MSHKTTISLTEFRKKLFKIADRVRRPGTYYTLTEKGRPTAVLMSAEEFESWQETLEVMQDFPDLGKRMAEADEAIKSGAYKKWPTLEEVLAEEGYVARDGRSRMEYGVSSNNPAERKKKSKKNSR